MNYYKTLLQLQTLKPSGNYLAYCEETNSFYVYKPSSIIPVDGHQVLITGNGGNTRWINQSKTHNFQASGGANSIINNTRIDVGLSLVDNYVSNKQITKTVIFNTQFSTNPIISISKSGNYLMTLNNFRDAKEYFTNISKTGFTINFSSSTASYSNGDYIVAHWKAIGSL